MTQPSICVRQVSKRFRRGAQFDSLRDLVAHRFIPGGRRRTPRESFWAVHDVNFDVPDGEAFGIIGPNGAGKSTMLKLLAGILRPNRGEIHVRGRVSALIELGAGFHGDLTGRENVYLNACILGMTRRETRRKFDAIVDFAGIGEFLDTPVKRYSSGMHARLGFAIAAHVDPQVLLVDEVLSVGDRVFRSKCMDAMRRFQKDGVAIVFVSHDLGAVQRFCDRAMVLRSGQAIYCGDVAGAIGRYYEACGDTMTLRTEAGVGAAEIRRVRLTNAAGQAVSTVSPGDCVRFEFDVVYKVDMEHPSVGLSVIRTDDHLVAFETSSTRLGFCAPPARAGDCQAVRYEFQMNVLPGEYAVGLHVRERDALCYAVEDPYAVRLMVDGPAGCGGVAHVSPQCRIQRRSDVRPIVESSVSPALQAAR